MAAPRMSTGVGGGEWPWPELSVAFGIGKRSSYDLETDQDQQGCHRACSSKCQSANRSTSHELRSGRDRSRRTRDENNGRDAMGVAEQASEPIQWYVL
jgi:hypothetical protein